MKRVKVEGDLFHGRVPEGAVYVGRGAPGLKASRFGNPFIAAQYGREGAARRLQDYLNTRRNPWPGWYDLIDYPSDDEIRAELAGRDLACWCPLPADGEPDYCHAATLLEIANGGVPQEADVP